MPKTPKKKGRHSDLKPAGPDDPIYQGGLVISTPHTARPGYKAPEPKPEADKPAKDGED